MRETQVPVRSIVRGAFQTMGGAYLGRLTSLAAFFLLARALTEDAFGHVDLALAVFAMLVALRNLGLHFALLHEQDRIGQLAPTHLALSMGLGSLSVFAALGLAFFYYSGITAQALVLFAVFDLFRTAATTSETQLRRNLEFGPLALSHALATIAAAIIGVATAYLGGGAWALVFGYWANSVGYVVVYCGLLWSRQPLPLGRLREFEPAGARRLIRYGLWFWIGGVMRVLILQADKFIVGTLLGTAALGFYARAHAFAQIPAGAVTHAIVSVTGAVYARYQEDRQRLSAAFRRALRLILRATVAISLFLVLEAEGLTRILLGENWLPMVPALRYLILYSACRPLLDDIHALLMGVGDPKRVVGFTSVQAGLLLLSAPLLTSRLGIEGTALSMDLMALIGLVLALYFIRRYVDLPLASTFVPPLVAGCVGGVARLGVADAAARLPLPLAVITGGAIFSLAYAATLLALERRALLDELRTVWTALRAGPDPSQDQRP